MVCFLNYDSFCLFVWLLNFFSSNIQRFYSLELYLVTLCFLFFMHSCLVVCLIFISISIFNMFFDLKRFLSFLFNKFLSFTTEPNNWLSIIDLLWIFSLEQNKTKKKTQILFWSIQYLRIVNVSCCLDHRDCLSTSKA